MTGQIRATDRSNKVVLIRHIGHLKGAAARWECQRTGVEMTARSGWQKRFLATLRETANVRLAIESAGAARSTAYAHRKSSTTFRDAWDDALDEAVDLLEAEARRRAFAGVEEPVFYQGVQVGVVRKYSDLLLIFLLKAHRPRKFRERVELSGDPDAPPLMSVVVNSSGRRRTAADGQNP